MKTTACHHRAPGWFFLLLFVAAAAARAEPQGVLGDTLWETMQRGGEVMYVILLFSVAGLAFILEVAFRTRRGSILPPATEKLLQTPEGRQLVDDMVNGNGTACIHRILKVGHLWRKGTHEQIQIAIQESVDEILWRFKRAIRPIGIIANTAPLLGLLGTVIGIVQAFDEVAKHGALGDPAALAGGISKALLTTCFGLIVAIPMLLAYHFYIGKVESLLRRCEELAKEAYILPPE